MKFLIDDNTGMYFPDGDKVLVSTKTFEKIVNDFHKYETAEVTGMENGIIEVWIHFFLKRT